MMAGYVMYVCIGYDRSYRDVEIRTRIDERKTDLARVWDRLTLSMQF